MLRNVIWITGILFCFATVTTAQTTIPGTTVKKGCSCAFNSVNQVGVLTGERGSSFLAQTINGIRYKTWFAGVGVGLDFYKTRGIPLFLDIRKYILNKPATPFIYADGGIHYSWPTEKDKEAGWNVTRKFNNGLYYDFGLGYKAPINQKHAFLLSVGYSVKKIEETNTSIFYCPQCPNQESVERFNYTFNRLSIKAGWQF